jgi:hypothetical protein
MHRGEVGTEIATALAVGADPAASQVADRVDELLRRTCDLARALTGAERAALKLCVDDDPTQTRKYFSLGPEYGRWRDYRADPRGLGLHGIEIPPGQAIRLTQAEVEAHPAWTAFGDQAQYHPRSGAGSPPRSAARVGGHTVSCNSPTRRTVRTSTSVTKSSLWSWLESSGRHSTRFARHTLRADLAHGLGRSCASGLECGDRLPRQPRPARALSGVATVTGCGMRASSPPSAPAGIASSGASAQGVSACLELQVASGSLIN